MMSKILYYSIEVSTKDGSLHAMPNEFTNEFTNVFLLITFPKTKRVTQY